MLPRPFRVPLMVSAPLVALALFLALAPAPFNLLPAQLVFSVLDTTFESTTDDEGLHFRAAIRYTNSGPVRADIGFVRAEAFSTVNGSFLFADDIHKFFSLEVGAERVLILERPINFSWDSIAFFIKVKLDWFDDLEGVLLPGQELVLDI